MKYFNWNLDTALSFVKSKRVVAKPNPGFMEQLKKYEMRLVPGVSRPVSGLRFSEPINQFQNASTFQPQTQPVLAPPPVVSSQSLGQYSVSTMSSARYGVKRHS